MTQLNPGRSRPVNYTQESKAILDPRRRKIVELRESGKTFHQIGETLGISRGNAHVLYTHAIRRMLRSGDPLGPLSQRARNCLAREGLETREQLIDAIAKGSLNLRHIPHCGPKTHAEFCRWAGLRNDGKVISPRPN